MRIKKKDITINCSKETKHFVMSSSSCEICEDNYRITLTETDTYGVKAVFLKLCISRKNTWDMTGLALEKPVQIALTLEEEPEAMTAMYMYNEWWTRPAFLREMSEIPDRTQVVYLKFKDHCSCFLPMVGKIYKTTVCQGEQKGRLYLQMEAGTGGHRDLDEMVYLMADGKNVQEAVDKVFHYLHEREGLLLREERAFPDMLKYLGWCSWDAFYKELNEEKFRAKAEELIEKQVPVRWMLFDDGWMKGREDMLSAFEADAEKFPDGFGPLITEIKNKSWISWFGVWHALGGYWAGVDPESQLAEQEKEHLYATANGRLVPDPEKGAGFYRNWYRYLSDQQIDFVKVDGQSAVPIYFHQDQPTASAARGMNRELEKAAAFFDGNVINCMGMAMENILARPETGMSRNSDDFVPKKEGGFAEHLLQNAYNAIYHNEVYHCDWDMFWTMHPDAAKHSLLRAVSGGPVYFSDRIGETCPDVGRKLCYEDGRLLLLDRAARPTEDSIFADPMLSGVLKLQNIGTTANGQTVGVLAAFNLTGETQSLTLTASDIPEMKEGKAHWLYNYFTKELEILTAGSSKTLTLEAEQYAYFLLLPKTEGLFCAGLSEKYAGFLAVEAMEAAEDTVNITLTETGKVLFFSEKELTRVLFNENDVSGQLQRCSCLYELNIHAAPEKMKLQIEVR